MENRLKVFLRQLLTFENGIFSLLTTKTYENNTMSLFKKLKCRFLFGTVFIRPSSKKSFRKIRLRFFEKEFRLFVFRFKSFHHNDDGMFGSNLQVDRPAL
ncbi:hypothetical protein LEP1GSC161_3585 [Leptospira santarosai str. CBC1416]|uniref:Uncharacterized protein n=1 Tax=Leptospira santarosai str. CBC1416 TaxID=1193059 RepID=M6VLJ0_9LEPT|nr:hypothetical protein LEP1GSC161_3585 [Leptospira santarosai str. CBC1416]